MAQHRWRDAELRGRGSEAASIGNRNKSGKVGEITAYHW
jgi:hypothetical protein